MAQSSTLDTPFNRVTQRWVQTMELLRSYCCYMPTVNISCIKLYRQCYILQHEGLKMG
jgi:hypothetical protein